MTQNHTDINPSWGIRFLPQSVRPYILLMRLDRPVGIYLLLWPCLWSLFLAASSPSWTLAWWGILFCIGAIVMRGAGCVINDLIDQDLDAQVSRTRHRPLPSGMIQRQSAGLFACGLCLAGFGILIQFNFFAIGLGATSLCLVGLYPFMKRLISWPQVILGLTFNWGALMGWAVVTGRLEPAALVLYLGGVCWTIGYDTIYAHQDRPDDHRIGVHSTALSFGHGSRIWIAGFYGTALMCWSVAGILAHASWPWFTAVFATSLHFIWQIRHLDIDNPAQCLHLFRANIKTGAFLCFGAALALFT